MDARVAFVVVQMFGYDAVNPPPANVPAGFHKWYVCDTSTTRGAALGLGWEYVVVVDIPAALSSDRHLRMQKVADVMTRVADLLPEGAYDHVFRCDANVRRLFDEWTPFALEAMASGKALYCTTGYYSGVRDTIEAELASSLHEAAWSPFHEQMKKFTLAYRTALGPGIPAPIVSAKYVGWNLHHPHRPRLVEAFAKDLVAHWQGNIILSYMAASPDFGEQMFVKHIPEYNNCILSPHNHVKR